MFNYVVVVIDVVLSPAFLLIFWQHTNDTATICLNSVYQSDGHESTACSVTSTLPKKASRDGERSSAHPK